MTRLSSIGALPQRSKVACMWQRWVQAMESTFCVRNMEGTYSWPCGRTPSLDPAHSGTFNKSCSLIFTVLLWNSNLNWNEFWQVHILLDFFIAASSPKEFTTSKAGRELIHQLILRMQNNSSKCVPEMWIPEFPLTWTQLPLGHLITSTTRIFS